MSTQSYPHVHPHLVHNLKVNDCNQNVTNRNSENVTKTLSKCQQTTYEKCCEVVPLTYQVKGEQGIEMDEFAATEKNISAYMNDGKTHFDCADCHKIGMSVQETRLHYILTGHFTKA